MLVRGAILFAVILAICWGAISQHSPQQWQTDKKQAEDQKSIGHNSQKQVAIGEQANNPCNSKCRICEPEKNWWEKTLTDPVASFTGVLALFTLGLIVVGVRQEFHLRDTARKELRAYIGVIQGSMVWTERNNLGRHIDIHLRLENTGKTMAKKAVLWVNGGVRKSKDSAGPFPESKETEEVVFMPGAYWNKHLNVSITSEELDKLMWGGWVVFAWGRITYEDIYGKPHQTDFRFFNCERREATWDVCPDGRGISAT